MKCSEFEKRIYLYDELTTHEREEVDAHISTCAHCMHLLNDVCEMHKVVAACQSETPSLRNHAAMTRRIMDAVGDMQQEDRSLFGRMAAYLRQAQVPAQVRYHMLALSAVLMTAFMIEYTGGIEQRGIVEHYPVASQKTELNLASFHTVFLETRKKNNQASIAIADCVTRCLDAPAPDCKACTDKFIKP